MTENFIVVDCGATKCDWYAIHDGEKLITHTTGFNPTYHSKEVITGIISNQISDTFQLKDWSAIYFYGAGCGLESAQHKVENVLTEIFSVEKTTIHGDLFAAARATYDGGTCIVGILGTGSNSAVFDGHTFTHHQPSLGYILGDDGGGSQLGRDLIRAYFYLDLPEHINEVMENYLGDRAHVLQQIYKEEHPNQFLAQLTKEIHPFRMDPSLYPIIKKSLLKFFEFHIFQYPDYQTKKIHLVGSIAFHFREIIEDICRENNLHLGTIISKPIDKLIDYHKK